MDTSPKPLVIAGPCAAESYETISGVAERLKKLADELNFDYVFKASFDKANRTSLDSPRGPGLEQALEWFRKLREEQGVRILTDVHETNQVEQTASAVDYLQIPAFLCRQTDLVTAAARSGCSVNIKKGQFVAPEAMEHIYQKARDAADRAGNGKPVSLTERGYSFGYGNLVVDMRAFAIMADTGAPLIFDITHSTQLPSAGGGGQSGGQRRFAPLLARSATATGYLSGYFLEVHPDPAQAISDKDAQLSLEQGERLLRQLVPLWRTSREFPATDVAFKS